MWAGGPGANGHDSPPGAPGRRTGRAAVQSKVHAMSRRPSGWLVGRSHKPSSHQDALIRAGAIVQEPWANGLAEPTPRDGTGGDRSRRHPTPTELAALILTIIGIVLTIYFGLRPAGAPMPAAPAPAPATTTPAPAGTVQTNPTPRAGENDGTSNPPEQAT